MEAFDAPVEEMDAPTDAETFALGVQGHLPEPPVQAPWLSKRPPKKRPFVWPKGAKSPSWVARMARCPKQHAERYRNRREDPTGFDGVVGNVIHGALEDAVNIRLSRITKNNPIPSSVSPPELLYLIELQAGAIRQDTSIVEGDPAWSIVTMEVLARAREIVSALPTISLDNAWVDRNGRAGAEYIWNFYATPQLQLAGIADLIQARYHPGADLYNPYEVVITDWKTGSEQLPTEAELRLDAQAQFQLAWARRAFPNTPRLAFRIWNLSHDKRIEVTWSPGLDDLAMSFARGCWNLWQSRNETAITGEHCAYCPYRADCNQYRGYLEKQGFKPPHHLANLSVAEAMRLNFDATKLKKLAEAQKKDTGKLIKRAIGFRREHAAGLFVARKRTRKTERFRDESGLLQQLSDRAGVPLASLINTMCSIKEQELAGWVRTLPLAKQADVKASIEAHKLVGETAPWIEVKQKDPVF